MPDEILDKYTFFNNGAEIEHDDHKHVFKRHPFKIEGAESVSVTTVYNDDSSKDERVFKPDEAYLLYCMMMKPDVSRMFIAALSLVVELHNRCNNPQEPDSNNNNGPSL